MGVVRRLRARAAARATDRDGERPEPERFPHLAAFLAGYLHQDFVLDHKTPAGALRAFLADAGEQERAALRDEWRAFRSAIDGLSWKEVRTALAALGGAWRPGSRAALLSLFDALDEPGDLPGR